LVIAAFADGPLLQQLLAPPHGPRASMSKS
jgi:hypothetical protein